MHPQLEERERSLAEQNNAYEQARSERNCFSRDLIVAQSEVKDARQQLSRTVSLQSSWCYQVCNLLSLERTEVQALRCVHHEGWADRPQDLGIPS